MKWRKGTFVMLQATRRIEVMRGGFSGKVVALIDEGDVVEFDGTTLRRARKDVEVPSLRGAVAAGWLSIVEGRA